MQQGGVGHVTAHASAGGVLSKLQGGSFGHGFLNAGAMKGVGMFNASKIKNVYASTLVQATAGGTFSDALYYAVLKHFCGGLAIFRYDKKRGAEREAAVIQLG